MVNRASTTVPASTQGPQAPQSATITNVDTGQTITVQFNPQEFSHNRDNTFSQASVPGRSAPILQYSFGNMDTLEMELFFDTYEQQRDVRQETSKVTSLLDIDPDTHAPPVLVFQWGPIVFQCVLARAHQRFIMFLPDGTPVRARVQVTFNYFDNSDLEPQETKRATANFTKLHVITQGETLSSIAGAVYSNPLLWRPLAIANAIDNPHILTAGVSLTIPPLPYTDPESGKVYQ